MGAKPCGEKGLGKLIVSYPSISDDPWFKIQLEKKVPLELFDNDSSKTIGSSHGWVATLKEDGLLRLQDDLNPSASYTDPKHIPLPPLVTLPHCQTQIITNVSMSSPSPDEDEDCVVAVKFLGPQLSFCRPAQRNSEWTNITLENHPSFYSSRVIFSKKYDRFLFPGSGGQIMGSWDHRTEEEFEIHRLQFKNLPKLDKTRGDLLHSCYTIENLVESVTTGEIFLVKQYKKFDDENKYGEFVKLKTEYLMVFKLDEQGNAVYTQDIGDLCIFLSRSEPFCVPATSLPGTAPYSNFVYIDDLNEMAVFYVGGETWGYGTAGYYPEAYYVPPQNIY